MKVKSAECVRNPPRFIIIQTQQSHAINFYSVGSIRFTSFELNCASNLSRIMKGCQMNITLNIFCNIIAFSIFHFRVEDDRLAVLGEYFA